MKRSSLIAILTGALVFSAPAQAQTAMPLVLDESGARQQGDLLPPVFAGWQRGNLERGTNAAAADPAYASVLQEYGFEAYEKAVYRQGGRRIEVRAARFLDASGAYGAFTFYRRPFMVETDLGDRAAMITDQRVMFQKANLLGEVEVGQVTAMTMAHLRELVSLLPLPERRLTHLPPVQNYLPPGGLRKDSIRYVLGPEAMAALHIPLAADLVDFSRSAEVVTGEYATPWGTATLALVSYPTPQIAAEEVEKVLVAKRRQSQAEGAPNVIIAAKRSGPLVAVVEGAISEQGARSLLAQVSYDAEVTWNQATKIDPRENVGSFLIAAFSLVGLVLVFALTMGVAFGGVRLLLKKLFPDRVFDRPESLEIIELHLGRGPTGSGYHTDK